MDNAIGDERPDSVPGPAAPGAGGSGSPSSSDPPTPVDVASQAPFPYSPPQSQTPFPQLRNEPAQDEEGTPPPKSAAPPPSDVFDDEDPTVAKPFHRTSSPDAATRGGTHEMASEEEYDAATETEKTGDESRPRRKMVHKMHKFSLYETASRYYIVGGDVTEKRYRILKIDRMVDDSDLSITDDKIVYSQKQMNQLLDTIDDGNKGTGGIRLKCTTWGLLGFIKFTGPYYMLLITKRSIVAMVGGHYVYQIEGTELIPLTPARYRADQRNTEESRFLTILNNLDLTRSFYYSYSYDVTRTLQHNVTKERTALNNGLPLSVDDDLNTMFVWNSHLLQPAVDALKDPFDWCRPIIHGYVDQASVSVYGRTAFITIIARRSRYFAGARFLKRGANDLGYVANDVETEQIVSEALTTSFHAPGGKLFASPEYTSYVQHRGSIPLYWTQDNTGVTPKPPIELNLVDPFYSAAALHFDNLFERYGSPIYVLNLVKMKERTPRESKLLEEYRKAITYLNQFLPENNKIIQRHWDMSRAAKDPSQDVIQTLEDIAEDVVLTTGFFQNGDGVINPTRVQNGVARTNCIDCLDRTNAAQFVIGKRALGHQLHALGILGDTAIEYDTDAVNLFTHMYHDHGDTIAVQYGGSQLVNTMETYRKINQWTSHSRDMIESFKRYYNNSFMDGQRQEAYNLFLGNYIFAQGQPMLWDLATDYYLHHADPRLSANKNKRSYIDWYTPEFLKERSLPKYKPPKGAEAKMPVSYFDDYWLEYYRPLTLSSLQKMFPYKMNSTIKYIPFKSTQDGRYDLSPFRVRARTETDGDAHDKRRPKKGVTILDPNEIAKAEGDDDTASIRSGKGGNTPHNKGPLLQRWLHHSPVQDKDKHQNNSPHGIMKESATPMVNGNVVEREGETKDTKVKATPLEKSRQAQWTFTKVVHESLNPSVSAQEADDYARYVSHPQNLPLVVSSATPADVVGSEYQEYINGSWQSEGLLLVPPGSTLEDAGLAGSAAVDDYWNLYSELLKVGDDPLTVNKEDVQKKRYKAYGKWLRGKSLFKQQPID
ncbi:phosphatidylinositol-3,5-bisphosphate 5-phosphatase [Gnomoniopsis smithogilvyi]|uniref:Phosphatidylinositol-3,5-bisphosphate 5-phosphatase n=1 Tax=Gnomoniopsis smithogilvyi TaxID=1191159 RepID=A0A9W8YQ31_9PEZI|nr:phosphatidylinositol-3,5-bisphosphate 5-phosphatase [Gnomoniopsis smithogilvyi]